MARTHVEVLQRVADADAKAEASISMSNVLSYSDYDKLRDDEYSSDDIPTCELNNFLLDGNTDIPDYLSTANFGVWSNSLTDENGDFITNPVLTLTTSGSYSTAGFTVTFWGDTWPKQTVTTWYNGTTVLGTSTDTCTGFTHFIDNAVNGFNKITIEFVGTDTPYRRIKICEIDYGEIFSWTDNDIVSANVLEEVNLTSEELTINTLDLTIHDASASFNMLNPSGVYEYLQQKQQFRVQGYVDGSIIPMGFYYLDTWENSSAVIAKFSAYSIIGVMDTVTYQTSSMWSSATVSTIVASIMAVAGVTRYSIDSGIASQTLSGYIPICTCREALHYVCFAARASCISKRDGSIKIIRLPSSETEIKIEKSQKMGDQSIKQNTLVNSVAVTAYAFTQSTDESDLYSEDSLDAGTYNITFDNPSVISGISRGTLLSSGINFAKVQLTSSGSLKIYGYEYNSSTTIYTVEASGLTDSKRSQATIDSIYLISKSNAQSVAQFIYDDYQRRIVQDFEIAVTSEKIGDNVDVDTMLNYRKSGTITSLDMDLTGGFLAKCEVR